MAQTINRNQEITNEDYQFLKQRFKERTGTRALYRCVEYVVNKVPDFEKIIQNLEKENSKLKVKHNLLIEIIRKKQLFDQKLDNMVYPDETE